MSNDYTDDEYLKNLNKNSKYRNDLIYVNSVYDKVQQFDPETLQDIFGGLIGLYGVTGCGKSILLREMIYKNKNKYPGGIYLMCGTAGLQPSYDYIPEVNRIPEYSETFLDNMWTKQNKDFLAGKHKKILVVMDDFITDPGFKKQKSKIITKYAIGARHIGITVIMLTQYFCGLDNDLRTQMRLAVCFKTSCDTEKKKFTDTYLSAKNKHIGEVIFGKITRERKYQCMIMECYKNEIDELDTIKKFIASPDLPKFKIKEYPASKYLKLGLEESSEKYNLPSCADYETFIF